MADPYRYFRIEARELVTGLGHGLGALGGADPASVAEIVGKLLRLAHTLKGAARVVRLAEIAEAAHALEDRLAEIRDSGRADRLEELLAEVGGIAARVDALDGPARALAPATPAPDEPVLVSLATDPIDLERVIGCLGEVRIQLRALSTAERTVRDANVLVATLLSQLTPGRGPTSLDKPRALARTLARGVADLERAVAGPIERIHRELDQVQVAAERLQLVPLRSVVAVVERITSDAARSVGKAVEVRVVGGDVRVEVHVASALQRALVQLARNAVAHGIEAERGAKPAAGRIEVVVERLGTHLEVRFGDDGRGIDLDAVRRAARSRGITADLDDDAVVALLLGGGLSTSRAVTELSGRGVGLDVARDAVGAVGGSVSVRTFPGAGTVVALTVPLGAATLEGVVVAAGGVELVVPLDAVRSTAIGSEDWITDDGAIPSVPLARVLGGRSERVGATVRIEHRGQRAAIAVEALRGIEVVVVRPLPAHAPCHPAVVGACLDRDGDPRLVLDPAELVAACGRGVPPEPENRPARLPILVVDDSLTTRMLEQSILQSAGYEVDVASSGEEALVKVRARRYGLMLVDIEMPGMDGFTVIGHLRADPALRDLPAIVVTSRESPDDLRRGVAVGANGWVVKSQFHQGRLLERIEELLR